MGEPTIAYFHGEFRPIEECTVGIRSKALHYGLGCFEGIRAYWTAEKNQLYLFRVAEHYDRLAVSCRILGLGLSYSRDELIDITLELVRRNKHREDIYIRPIVFHNSQEFPPLITDADMEFAIYTLPLSSYLDTSVGVRVMVSSWRRINENMIPVRAKPTAAYLNSALARMEAERLGCDEAIMLTADGYVSEGSAEHVFIIRDGTLITPPSTEDNLDGITRRTIEEMVPAELGREVVLRRVGRTELYAADEIFLCGTGAQVIPVAEIDGRRIADGRIGPITKEIQELYFRVVHGQDEKYESWCLPVYE